MGKIAQRFNPTNRNPTHRLKSIAKKHGGTYTRKVLRNGVIVHRLRIPSLQKNPILAAIGAAAITGFGVGLGIQGVNLIKKGLNKK